MSIIVGFIGQLSYNFVESLRVFWKTRDFSTSSRYFVMSYRSDTLSFEEVTETDFGLGHKKSLNSLDAQSEVVCAFPVKQIEIGSTFKVQGNLMRSCERLSINFMATSGKHSDIALHVNPRPLQNYIVRNSKISGECQT